MIETGCFRFCPIPDPNQISNHESKAEIHARQLAQ
jgi:hypothetical protein